MILVSVTADALVMVGVGTIVGVLSDRGRRSVIAAGPEWSQS